jgi:cytochrome c553
MARELRQHAHRAALSACKPGTAGRPRNFDGSNNHGMNDVRAIVVATALGCFAALPAAAQTVQQRLPTCLACHGENGQSQNPGVPSLGAQQAYYVTVQLLMFRDRMRLVDPMNEMTKGLSDADLQSFADIIAKLPAPQPADGPVDEARIARARAVAQQNHCDFCHTTNFAGQQNVPRIADQREDYLVKALRGYKDNSRRGYDTAMADVVPAITDDQILDLAYYLARAK